MLNDSPSPEPVFWGEDRADLNFSPVQVFSAHLKLYVSQNPGFFPLGMKTQSVCGSHLSWSSLSRAFNA